MFHAATDTISMIVIPAGNYADVHCDSYLRVQRLSGIVQQNVHEYHDGATCTNAGTVNEGLPLKVGPS